VSVKPKHSCLHVYVGEGMRNPSAVVHLVRPPGEEVKENEMEILNSFDLF
jgi:hypothetical protein